MIDKVVSLYIWINNQILTDVSYELHLCSHFVGSALFGPNSSENLFFFYKTFFGLIKKIFCKVKKLININGINENKDYRLEIYLLGLHYVH